MKNLKTEQLKVLLNLVRDDEFFQTLIKGDKKIAHTDTIMEISRIKEGQHVIESCIILYNNSYNSFFVVVRFTGKSSFEGLLEQPVEDTMYASDFLKLTELKAKEYCTNLIS